MRIVHLPCADGTDPRCDGRIPADEYSDSYYDLTDEQQQEVQDLASDYTREDGDFEEEIDGIFVKIAPSVCGECGSDYTRDNEGNIMDV